MSIIGAGFTLTPWKLVGAETSIQRFRLPPASIHIPHGNFASEEVQKLYISEMNLSISSQIFLKHGIQASKEDLEVFTIQRNNEFLNVSICGNEVMQNGQINDLKCSIERGRIELTGSKQKLLIDTNGNVAQIMSKSQSDRLQ